MPRATSTEFGPAASNATTLARPGFLSRLVNRVFGVRKPEPIVYDAEDIEEANRISEALDRQHGLRR